MKRTRYFTAKYNSFLHLVLTFDGQVHNFFVRMHNEEKALDLLANAEKELVLSMTKEEHYAYIDNLYEQLGSLCGKNA